MQKITLYRFSRPVGGMTVSPVKPEGECVELTRLVADEGMLLSNGESTTFCVDTDNPSEWSEIEA